MSEVELKLWVDPANLPQARRYLQDTAAGNATSRDTLVSTYFDTKKRDLRQRELLLRVRKQGRHFVQTVKAEAKGGRGAIERGEWEDAIDGENPELDAHAAKVGVSMEM